MKGPRGDILGALASLAIVISGCGGELTVVDHDDVADLSTADMRAADAPGDMGQEPADREMAPPAPEMGEPSDLAGPVEPDMQAASTPDMASLPAPDMRPPPPPPKDCIWRAIDYDAPLRELDIMPGDPARLVFEVPNVPDPASIERAELTFASYDADHPGQEGEIFVNGQGGYQIPADSGWDNQPGTGRVDITGALIPGRNVIAFGAGSTPRTFYRIGRVAIEASARVEQCETPPEPPPAQATERTMGYREAQYDKRHNWVLRCDGIPYAFTAANFEEHRHRDCDGAFNPDGSRTGKAIFASPDVVDATYDIQIRARHTVNRSSIGALFVVNGEEKRLTQRLTQNPSGAYETTTWGQRRLSGTVTVTLDSSREGNSDSVEWVKLTPVAP